MLSTENIIITPNLTDEEATLHAQQVLAAFASAYGDHIMLLRIFEGYQAETNKKEWCKLHFINYKAMQKVMDVHQQLKDYWTSLGWDIVSCSSKGEDNLSYDPVRKCFASAFFPRMAVLLPDGSFNTQFDKKKVHIHPSSCLFQKKPEIVIYDELVMTTKQYMRNILKVDKEWYFELQPQFHKLKTLKTQESVV